MFSKTRHTEHWTNEKINKSRIKKTANVELHRNYFSPNINGVMKSGGEWRPLKIPTY
jgi:hypothetical protein